jgi:hypothetical protein
MTWVSSFAHSARRRQGGRQERHGFYGIYVNAKLAIFCEI